MFDRRRRGDRVAESPTRRSFAERCDVATKSNGPSKLISAPHSLRIPTRQHTSTSTLIRCSIVLSSRFPSNASRARTTGLPFFLACIKRRADQSKQASDTLRQQLGQHQLYRPLRALNSAFSGRGWRLARPRTSLIAARLVRSLHQIEQTVAGWPAAHFR